MFERLDVKDGRLSHLQDRPPLLQRVGKTDQVRTDPRFENARSPNVRDLHCVRWRLSPVKVGSVNWPGSTAFSTRRSPSISLGRGHDACSGRRGSAADRIDRSPNGRRHERAIPSGCVGVEGQGRWFAVPAVRALRECEWDGSGAMRNGLSGRYAGDGDGDEALDGGLGLEPACGREGVESVGG